MLPQVKCFSLNILQYINSRRFSVPHFFKMLESLHKAPFKSLELYTRAPGNELHKQKVLRVHSNLLLFWGVFHTTIPCNLLLTCFSWLLDYSAPFGIRLLITKFKPTFFFKKGNVLFLLMIKIALSTILYSLEMHQTFTVDC